MNIPSKHGIPFYPKTLSGVYGVNLYFGQAGKEQQRLQCESKVVYWGQYMDKYSIFHLSKEKLVVNKNYSGEYLYALAKECAKAIYPVTILTDNTRKVVLIRTYDIAVKWAETRERLVVYYQGEVAAQYLETESLYDKETDELCVTQRGVTKDSYTFGEFFSQRWQEQSMSNEPVRSEFKINYELNKTGFGINAIEGDFFVYVNKKDYYNIKTRAYCLEERPVEQETDSDFAIAHSDHLAVKDANQLIVPVNAKGGSATPINIPIVKQGSTYKNASMLYRFRRRLVFRMLFYKKWRDCFG